VLGTTGKTVVRHVISNPPAGVAKLATILKDLGLETVAENQSDGLEKICGQVIESLPDVATAIRKGNQKPVMRLVGEVMKQSKGRADAREARKILLWILAPESV
jgi:aspartyl-tRNA(Asn)/glutamyl-tRNA(Gln) amidotransferase subunit B